MEKRRVPLKAEICLKGHVAASDLNLDSPLQNNFCTSCGSKVINACPKCNAEIISSIIIQKKVPIGLMINGQSPPMGYRNSNFIKNENIPNYCHECGTPYPWTINFLENYKMILDLKSDEIDNNLKNNIFNATENLLKDNFSVNSQYVSILKLTLKKLETSTRLILISSLASLGGEALIKLLK